MENKKNSKMLVIIISVVVAVIVIAVVAVVLIRSNLFGGKKEVEIYQGEIEYPNAAELINSNVEKYYGAKVTNYIANGIQGWEVFHSDGKNVYLIATNYINVDKLPQTKSGIKITQGKSEMSAALDTVINDEDYSKGSASILTENPARKWLSYLETQTSSNNNMKAVAYLMDTNVWSEFLDDTGYASWAIGGPTIDMLIASYNRKAGQDYRLKVENEIGYQISRYGGVNWANYCYMSTSDSLYVLPTTSGATGMWLASPSASQNDLLMAIDYNSTINYHSYDSLNVGFRPVVCLNSSVKLQENADGTVTLK